MKRPVAKVSNSRLILLFYLFLIASVIWITRHILKLTGVHEDASIFGILWLGSFLLLSWGMIFSTLERPKTTTDAEDRDLNDLFVTILIPAYNEDPKYLAACIMSMVKQSRKPNMIHVTDDGSLDDYASVRDRAFIVCEKAHIQLSWVRTANGGKRHAQAAGINIAKDFTDIFVTVDSDTVLDPVAIEEGLKPFADKKVTAVAGIYLPMNTATNLLTRISSVWEVSWQLIDRSSQSYFNSVTVNSGVLAFYKADVILKNLDAYLSETFFNRPVKFSDDSLLTTYAMLEGKTVQQSTAFAFSATPDRVSHHIRRYVRWMRGSFIRSWWRFKYLPVNSYAYWWHLMKWSQLIMGSVVGLYLLYLGTFWNIDVVLYFVLIMVILSYAQALKFLTVIRNDQSRKSQALTFLLAPLAAVWAMTVLRVVRNYAYVTCLKTGWGTRKEVEVGL